MKRGFGTNNTLYFDCFSGLSGDMILASLIDLGVPFEVVNDAALAVVRGDYSVRTEKEERNAILVRRFFVDVNEAKQPHRHYSDIKGMIDDSALLQPVKDLANEIFLHIARAEAKVHNTSLEKVHFHEVGAVDSIVDIVGAAAAFDYIGARVVCAPIPTGTGFVQTAHGLLPLPAPATTELLKGIPSVGTDVTSELTTPTGAAIMRVVADAFGSMPEMIIDVIGMGAGSRTLETRPGILRAILGQTNSRNAPCCVIEANIDDMTGELAAEAQDALFEAGALDVWYESIVMKKNRPALKLSILCDPSMRKQVSQAIFANTTTIGLRFYQVGRMVLERKMTTVQTAYGSVDIKLALDGNNVVNAAPEFESCRRLAKQADVPVKRVWTAAVGAVDPQES